MVAAMMRSSRLMGPICCSFSAACFGASGVSFISGGASCACACVRSLDHELRSFRWVSLIEMELPSMRPSHETDCECAVRGS